MEKEKPEEFGDSEYLWDDDYELSEKEILEDNARLLRRQAEFRKAAEYVAKAFSGHSAVIKVVLFGSVASPLQKEVPRYRKYRRAGVKLYHECLDVDLAVWLDNFHALNELRRLRGGAVNDLLRDTGIGVAHHQVDVFVFSASDGRYAGRLCIFGKCPKGKFVCTIPGCGEHPFLQRLPDFSFDYDSLENGHNVVLHCR